MNDTIASAKERITLYAARYTDTMTGALETCKMGDNYFMNSLLGT